MKTNIAAIKAEIEIAREIYKTASEHHHSLYQGQQYIIGVISDLERKLKQALKSDRALNQARGKKQRRFTYKKGKKRNIFSTSSTVYFDETFFPVN